jgi:predicted ester cyclase
MTAAASLVYELVERVWNGGDLDALPEYYADPFEHDEGTGTLAGLREWHRDDAATWAGTAYVVLDCVAVDNDVALRWRASSIHVGPWGPVAPTGRRVEWTGAHFFRVEAGRIVAMHALADRFEKAMQLGVHMTPPDPRQEG